MPRLLIGAPTGKRGRSQERSGESECFVGGDRADSGERSEGTRKEESDWGSRQSRAETNAGRGQAFHAVKRSGARSRSVARGATMETNHVMMAGFGSVESGRPQFRPGTRVTWPHGKWERLVGTRSSQSLAANLAMERFRQVRADGGADVTGSIGDAGYHTRPAPIGHSDYHA